MNECLLIQKYGALYAEPNIRINTEDFFAYVLLDTGFPEIKQYGPLRLEYRPFYVGCGNYARLNTTISECNHSYNYGNSAKVDRILEIKRTKGRYIKLRIVGNYKNKKHALLIEAKLLNIIHKEYLTNASFPYIRNPVLKLKECEIGMEEYFKSRKFEVGISDYKMAYISYIEYVCKSKAWYDNENPQLPQGDYSLHDLAEIVGVPYHIQEIFEEEEQYHRQFHNQL